MTIVDRAQLDTALLALRRSLRKHDGTTLVDFVALWLNLGHLAGLQHAEPLARHVG